jgi:TPR repeat protein
MSRADSGADRFGPRTRAKRAPSWHEMSRADSGADRFGPRTRAKRAPSWHEMSSLVAVALLTACGGGAAQPNHPAAAAARDHEACLGDDAKACVRMAKRFEGQGAAVDWRRYRRVFESICATRYPEDPRACVAGAFHARACDLGVSASCASLASLYESRRLGKAERAAELWARACSAGDTASCARAAAALPPDKAAALFAPACAAGDQAACTSLADLLERGAGVTRDLPRARTLRDAACKVKVAPACSALARMWLRGVGGPRDGGTAWKLAEQACNLGDADACMMWGGAFASGAMGEPDMARQYELHHRAAGLYDKACDAGQARACGALGRMLRVGDGVVEDRERGLALELRGCRAGDGPACIAWATRGPHRVKVDRGGAHAIAAACLGGDGAACHAVGYLGLAAPDEPFRRGCAAGDPASCSAYGIGALPIDEAHRHALDAACEVGFGPGCYHLGVALESGGDATEGDAATRAYGRGCALAYAASCTRLGLMQQQGYLLDGSAGPRASFERACTGGDRAGCFELARLLREGSADDRATAAGMLERACNGGNADACAELGSVALLEKGCAGGAPAACLARAKIDEPAAWLEQAVTAARARCSKLRAPCGGQLSSESVVRGWTDYDGRPTFALLEAPACGVALERACVSLRDALVARCTTLDSGPGCFDAAAEIRDLAGAGLSIGSAPADAADQRGVKLADAACKKGSAASCAALGAAHHEGRGVPQDGKKADRLIHRACQLDKSYCP